MPQVKSVKVKSLFELCLDCVTRNMDELSKLSAGDEVYFIAPEISTPFDQLPKVILDAITRALQQKSMLKKQFIELLVTPQLHQLDLQGKEIKNDVSGMLDILYRASIRCCQLKILQLPMSPSFEDYVHFLPKFENLEVLDISMTSAKDKCLEILGTYCKHLRELDVSNCTGVTDEGIKGLCVSVGETKTGSPKQGQCKFIQKLLTCGTKVSKLGIQMALQNLSALKIFSSVSIQHLTEMHQADFKNKDVPKMPRYSLVKLRMDSNSPYRSGSLRKVLSLCPSLMKLEITALKGLTDYDLQDLRSLERLCELKISGFMKRNCEITFDGGVASLLKAIGSSVRTLTLEELGIRINIHTIAEFCPNLRTLVLNFNRNYASPKPNENGDSLGSKKIKMETTILKELHILQLNCLRERRELGIPSFSFPIPTQNLVSLLSSPSLIHIQISNCDSLTDEVFRKAAKISRFQKLAVLKLSHCDSVTEKGINIFMQETNPLHLVNLFHCGLLTEQNMKNWKQLASVRNWSLSM